MICECFSLSFFFPFGLFFLLVSIQLWILPWPFGALPGDEVSWIHFASRSNGQEKSCRWKSSHANFGRWMTKTLTSSFEKLAHFTSFGEQFRAECSARQTMSFNWDDLFFGLLFIFVAFFLFFFHVLCQFGFLASKPKYWQTYVISNEHTYRRWLWKRHKNNLILKNTLSHFNKRLPNLDVNKATRFFCYDTFRICTFLNFGVFFSINFEAIIL